MISLKQLKNNENKESFINIAKDIYRQKKKTPISTQKTIGYKKMFRNGICLVDDKTYSITLTFNDINYQLAHPEEKNYIFGSYCSWLNYYDHTVSIQMTYVNTLIDMEKERSYINIPLLNDEFDYLREEYENMLHNQAEKGTNGIIKKKFITITTRADNMLEAKAKLNRIEIDVISNFKSLGVYSRMLDGKERLEILNTILNQTPFKFKAWEELEERKIPTQDLIAPKVMDFSNKDYFSIGKRKGQTQYMIIEASEYKDDVLAKLLDLQSELIINFFITPHEHNKALKMIKGKISDIEANKIEDQKKAFRSGYDLDIGSPELKVMHEGATKIYDELQNNNERWFTVSILVTNISDDFDKLNSDIYQIRNQANVYNLKLVPYSYNQENCLNSILPLGVNKSKISRGLTTSALAGFVPFTTQELQENGLTLYYGLNALSNNMIMFNRKNLKNPNGLILGIPGAGKSFSAKREMTNVIMVTNDDIMICDPEGEYEALTKAFNGETISFSDNSKHFINPLDINEDYGEDDVPPVKEKIHFVLSFMELVCGGKDGLKAKELTIIDRCMYIIYREWINNPIPENIPILTDLYNALLDQNTEESIGLASALEIYVTGSLNLFNNRTNVDVNNRIVNYNIKNLGKNLKKLGMLIVQDQIWNRVSINRHKRKSTWYYVDEFHLLLKDKETAAYSVEFWKRFRKWGGIPTGITQNVKDLLNSKEIENIFENSPFIYLLSQAPGDRKILSDKLNISNSQLSYVTDREQGEGLLVYGSVLLPFKDKFPSNTKLYQLMTTKLEES